MKISILMPSYNQGRYIEAAILSVLDQSYSDKELIVIDGGSTDETISILRRYEDRLKYWVSEPDRGQAHALNKALEHTSGEIIGWLNSDDLYLPKAFARVIRAMQNNPEIGLVHGGRHLIDEHGDVVGWGISGPFEPPASGYVICSETAFWRSTSPAASIGFDESLHFCMDAEFFLRLHRCVKFLHLNVFLGAFRCYFDNKSSLMQDVFKVESEKLNQIYPEMQKTTEPRHVKRRMQGLIELAQNPKTLGGPYIKYRIKKLIKSKFNSL